MKYNNNNNNNKIKNIVNDDMCYLVWINLQNLASHESRLEHCFLKLVIPS